MGECIADAVTRSRRRLRCKGGRKARVCEARVEWGDKVTTGRLGCEAMGMQRVDWDVKQWGCNG